MGSSEYAESESSQAERNGIVFACGINGEHDLPYRHSLIDALAGAMEKLVEVQPLSEFRMHQIDEDSADTHEEMKVVRPRPIKPIRALREGFYRVRVPLRLRYG
jgi:hypothetical protein